MRNYTLVMDADDRQEWGIDTMSRHQLESASATVAHLTRAAVYRATDAGYPADADLADVFAAATAAQAVFTAETGDSTGAGAQTGNVSLGPLSLGSSRGEAMSDRSLQGRMSALVAPKAVEILAAHNLLNGAVGSGGWGAW